MTFALLRAGLPNSIVAAALALVPIVAIALAPMQRAPHSAVHAADVIVAGTSADLAASN
jgi:hypothetical protein